MRNFMRSLAVAAITVGMAEASGTIFKLGYETIGDKVLGQSIDLKGLNAAIEIPVSVSNGGYLCGFLQYSDLDLKQSQILGVGIDGDAEMFGFGLKYSFANDVSKDMSGEEAIAAGMDGLTPYVKVGYEKVDGSATVNLAAGRVTISDDDSDLFYGLGLEASLSDDIGIYVEWLDHKSSVLEDSSIKFGVMVKF